MAENFDLASSQQNSELLHDCSEKPCVTELHNQKRIYDNVCIDDAEDQIENEELSSVEKYESATNASIINYDNSSLNSELNNNDTKKNTTTAASCSISLPTGDVLNELDLKTESIHTSSDMGNRFGKSKKYVLTGNNESSKSSDASEDDELVAKNGDMKADAEQADHDANAEGVLKPDNKVLQFLKETTNGYLNENSIDKQLGKYKEELLSCIDSFSGGLETRLNTQMTLKYDNKEASAIKLNDLTVSMKKRMSQVFEQIHEELGTMVLQHIETNTASYANLSERKQDAEKGNGNAQVIHEALNAENFEKEIILADVEKVESAASSGNVTSSAAEKDEISEKHALIVNDDETFYEDPIDDAFAHVNIEGVKLQHFIRAQPRRARNQINKNKKALSQTEHEPPETDTFPSLPEAPTKEQDEQTHETKLEEDPSNSTVITTSTGTRIVIAKGIAEQPKINMDILKTVKLRKATPLSPVEPPKEAPTDEIDEDLSVSKLFPFLKPVKPKQADSQAFKNDEPKLPLVVLREVNKKN